MRKTIATLIVTALASTPFVGSPAQAATGPGAIVDSTGTAYQHTDQAARLVNVLTPEEEADDDIVVCGASAVAPAVAYVDYGKLFAYAEKAGTYQVTAEICKVSEDISYTRTVTLKVANPVRVAPKKTKKGKVNTYKFTNLNRQVRNADGRVALTGDVFCAYGSMKKSSPDDVFYLKAGKTEVVKSKLKKLDFFCATESGSEAGGRGYWSMG